MATTTIDTTPPQSRTSGRQYEADIGRFVASFWVLIYHYGALVGSFVPDVDTSFTQPVARYGYLGVPWFFLLSGYVISMSVDRSDNAKGFATRRLRRIWPTLAMSALTTTLFLILNNRGSSLLTLLHNLALLPVIDTDLPNVDGTYWSLWIELRFYIMAALVIRFGKRPKLEHVAYGLIVLSLVAELLIWQGQTGPILNVVYLLSLNAWSGLFGAGILFAATRSNGRWTTMPLVGIALSFVNAHQASDRAGNENAELLGFSPTNTAVLLSLLVCFYAFFFFLVKRPTGTKRGWHKPAAYLGALSYPLYLIHSHIGYQIFSTLDLPFAIEAALATLTALALAHVILRADEKL